MAEKKFKLDIFNVLGRLAKKDRKFSDEELKALAPMVIQRWLSGTNNEAQIILINQFANRYCFSLANHKELLVNLMTISCPGRFNKYSWLKRGAKNKGNTKIANAVIASYFNYPLRRASESVAMLDDETIIRYAEELGYQKDQIKDLKKELKSR